MKRIGFLLMVLSFVLFQSCENKIIQQVIALNINKAFQGSLDGSDAFTTFTFSISRAELMDKLDIPDDAEIKEVRLEGLFVDTNELEDSEADSVEIDAEVIFSTGEVRKIIQVKKYPVDTSTFAALSFIATVSTHKLETELETMMKNESSFRAINVDVNVRADDRLSLGLNVRVRMTVKYEICQEVPSILGIDGENCDL